MIKSCNWLFKDSPNLLLLLDDALICRDMTSVWQRQLERPKTGEKGIPAAEIFDIEVTRNCSKTLMRPSKPVTR